MMAARLIAALAAVAVVGGAVLWCRRVLGRLGGAGAVLAAVALGLFLSGFVALPEPRETVDTLGAELGGGTYALVAAMAFLETGAFVGLVAPGDVTLLVGGAIAGQGQIALLPLLASVWAAALLGDSASFLLGRHYGRALLSRHGRRLRLTPERIRRVEGYFERWGGHTIVIGRFIGLVRALAPFLAGASRMRYTRFLPFSVAGTAAWAATYVLLGFFFSRSLDEVAKLAGLATGALGLSVAVAVAVALVARRRARGRPLAVSIPRLSCRGAGAPRRTGPGARGRTDRKRLTGTTGYRG